MLRAYTVVDMLWLAILWPFQHQQVYQHRSSLYSIMKPFKRRIGHHLSSFWAEKVNMAHSGVLNYINVVLGQRHFNYTQVTPQLTFENQNVQDCVRNRAKYMGLGNNNCVVNNCKHIILFLTRSGQILIWFSWISSHRRPMYSIG